MKPPIGITEIKRIVRGARDTGLLLADNADKFIGYATAIMNMADLRGLAVHIQPLEAWIARKMEEWYTRYHGD